MFSREKIVFLLSGFILCANAAFAELDPELAVTQNQNEGGAYVGAGVRVGPVYSSEGQNPGVGLMLGVEPGYMVRRDSWGRIEVSGELGFATLSYRREEDVKVGVAVPFYGLVRFGYGFSLGSSVFSLLRVGIGPVMGTYRQSSDAGSDSSDASMGLAGQIGWEFVFPAAKNLDFLGGINLTHFAIDFGDVGDSKGRAVNLNMPAIYLGARYRF